MKRLACVALGLGFVVAAGAAEPAVGTIEDVQGAVTVASTQAVKRAASGMPVTNGTSILVASDGGATLVLNSGCVIGLAANQHVTVNSGLKCKELQASVKQLFPAYKVAQAPLGGGITPPPAQQQDRDAKASALPPAGGSTGVSGDAIAFGVLGGASLIAILRHDRTTPISAQ